MTTAEGVLIGESLRVGAPLEGVDLRVTKVLRADAGDVSAGQPRIWTFIHFEIATQNVEPVAQALSRVLSTDGGWYCDFRSPDETFVVFADRVFRYRRGDPAGRAEAEVHGGSHGVPDAQLDWPE